MKKYIIAGLLALSLSMPANAEKLIGACTAGNCSTGTGKFYSNQGDFYEGHFTNGVFNGKGTATLSTGHIYSGNFQDWLITDGVLTFPDGDFYIGHFKGLIPDGKGRHIYTEGSVYYVSPPEEL